MMFTVRVPVLGILLSLLPCCVITPKASHGPVSERLTKRLEKNAISKDKLMEQLKTGEMKVVLRPAAQNVTVPFRLINDTPVLKVGINGHADVPVQLDSGAARTMIGAATAVESEVTMLRAEDASVELKGVIGDEKGRVGILTPLQVGSWALSGYPCVVRTHDNVVRSGFGRRRFSSNLLGFDLAVRYASFLTIDYRAGKATYGFGEGFPTPQGARVAKAAFVLRGGVPFITLKSGRHSWEALVDTGSFNGIELSSKVAAKLGLTGQGEAVKGLYLMSVGGSVSSLEVGLRAVRLPELAIFGSNYKEVQATISPGIPRVGSFFLKEYRVTFDFRRGLIWLER
jgi:hypothetical protein